MRLVMKLERDSGDVPGSENIMPVFDIPLTEGMLEELRQEVKEAGLEGGCVITALDENGYPITGEYHEKKAE